MALLTSPYTSTYEGVKDLFRTVAGYLQLSGTEGFYEGFFRLRIYKFPILIELRREENEC